MKDFSVKIVVRSQRVLDAVERKFGSQSAMAKATGISTRAINQFVTMKTSPMGMNGWLDSAETFAVALGEYPSDLWPEHMREVKLKRATAEVSLDMDQVEGMLSIGEDNYEAAQAIEFASACLSDRYMGAVNLHMAGETFEAIGEDLGVTRERARQIVYKSMRLMRGKLNANGMTKLNEVISQ